MGFGGLGMWEIILIFLVVLLLFGAKRLPEIGASLGKGIREFKGSVREIEQEINRPSDQDTISSGTSSSSKPSGSTAGGSSTAGASDNGAEESKTSSSNSPGAAAGGSASGAASSGGSSSE